MARLELLQEEDVRATMQRAAFLDRLVTLRTEDPAADRLGIVHALTESAALHMAIDRNQEAMQRVNDAVTRMLALPIDETPLARLCLFGALTQRLGTRLTPDRIDLVAETPRKPFFWLTAHPAPASALIAAALLSGHGADLWHLFQPPPSGQKPAIGLVAVLNAPAYGLLAAFSTQPPEQAGEMAIATLLWLLRRFLLRLDLMFADPERRSLMLLPAPLVDWPMLAACIALARFGRSGLPERLRRAFAQEKGELAALGAFILQLAAELG